MTEEQQIEQQGNSGGLLSKLSWFSLGCGPLLAIAGFLMMFLLIGAFLGTSTSGGDTNQTANGPASATLSPSYFKNIPGWAGIFTFAESKTKIPAPLIAAIYLTEKHSDSLGADVQPNDQLNCSDNGSQVWGPAQIQTATFLGVLDKMRAAGYTGTSTHAPCDFQWSFVAAGFVILSKEANDLTRFNPPISQTLVKNVANAYCGDCNDHLHCSPGTYNYCDQAWRHYLLVSANGNVAYLPAPMALTVSFDQPVCGNGLL